MDQIKKVVDLPLETEIYYEGECWTLKKHGQQFEEEQTRQVSFGVFESFNETWTLLEATSLGGLPLSLDIEAEVRYDKKSSRWFLLDE